MKSTADSTYERLGALLAIAVRQLRWSTAIAAGDRDDQTACFRVGEHIELTYFSPRAARLLPDEVIVGVTVEALSSGEWDLDIPLSGLAEAWSIHGEHVDG